MHDSAEQPLKFVIPVADSEGGGPGGQGQQGTSHERGPLFGKILDLRLNTIRRLFSAGYLNKTIEIWGHRCFTYDYFITKRMDV